MTKEQTLLRECRDFIATSQALEYRPLLAKIDAALAAPAQAAEPEAPRIPDADTYAARHSMAVTDEWKRGWNYARVIQAKFGHSPDLEEALAAVPQAAEPAPGVETSDKGKS